MKEKNIESRLYQTAYFLAAEEMPLGKNKFKYTSLTLPTIILLCCIISIFLFEISMTNKIWSLIICTVVFVIIVIAPFFDMQQRIKQHYHSLLRDFEIVKEDVSVDVFCNRALKRRQEFRKREVCMKYGLDKTDKN